MSIKDYLSYEQNRNKANAATYERILRIAFPGKELSVLVGHHIGFEFDRDLSTENEIPSADSLMFDHDIMRAVFGADCITVMIQLAAESCETRDVVLRKCLDSYKGANA